MAATQLCVIPALLLVVFTILQISALQYENGKTYKYSYKTSVLFNDIGGTRGPVSARDTGVHVSLELDITPVLQELDTQLFKLKINTATVLSVSRENQEKTLGTLLKYPIYFELTKDSVGRVFVPEADSGFCSNIKKGIVSLFQVQEKTGERSEIDVSGECSVEYSQTSPTEITKTKKECANLEIAGQFSNPNKVLGVSVSSKTTLYYVLENNIIKSISGRNRVTSHLEMRKSLNGGATVSQKLTFQESVQSTTLSASDIDTAIPLLEKELGKSFIFSLLPSEAEVTQCSENCESPKDLVKKIHDDLVAAKISTVVSAKAFLKMLKSFRSTGKDTISEVLTLPESYHIVPQLIDIATATQTSSGQKAMMELLVFEESYGTEHPERYLLAAAYSSHPGEYLLTDLMKLLKKPVESVLMESLLFSTGAIFYTYCQHGDQHNQQIVKDFTSILTEGLDKCADDPCRLMYLRAMGNAGLPDTVAVIMQHATTSNNSMVSITAIEALRRIPHSVITARAKASLSNIFHQNDRRYDSSVRVAGLDMLLQIGPSLAELRNILLAIDDQDQFELSAFIKTKVLDRANHDINIRNTLRTILKEAQVNNYRLMALSGKSSSFTGYIAKTDDLNCTYNLLFENSNAGVMKKSGIKVELLGGSQQPFMNIGIYGEALESMMSSDDGDAGGDGGDGASEDGPEIAAGLSFSLLDVLLKQYEFFRGMSGLMSAVWNAPSELTSALQGNLLLQDHSQRVHLSNGMILNVEVTGVISINLSGYVSISLWNRNCETLIKNSGALYVEGSMQLESNELAAGIRFTGEGESAIDFLSDAEFYEMPLKMCLQMKRPQFKFKQTFNKFERIKGLRKFNINFRSTKNIPAESFFLNKANSKECKEMKKDEA